MSKVITGPAKNKSAALEISETQSNRVVVGLSWNPLEQSKSREFFTRAVSGMEELMNGDIQLIGTNITRLMERNDDPDERDGGHSYDLDLSCYAFDKSGNLVSIISPDIWESISEDGNIYHSGDNMTGDGGPDDEQIHIETKNLSPDVVLFFVVVSDCNFSLDEIEKAEIRIADSKTNQDTLKVAMEPSANLNASAYVFCSVYNEDGTWKVRHVGEYADFHTDWETSLKKFL